MAGPRRLARVQIPRCTVLEYSIPARIVHDLPPTINCFIHPPFTCATEDSTPNDEYVRLPLSNMIPIQPNEDLVFVIHFSFILALEGHIDIVLTQHTC